MNILYLEDDVTLSQTVEELLLREGYNIFIAYDGKTALELAYKECFDLFIFDVNLPDINGFELLQSLRDADITTPTIFTTSFQTLDHITQGYNCGGDDYIKKPFYIDELLLHIQALLKREFQTQTKCIKISDTLTFEIEKEELRENQKHIPLNPKETQLLKLLLKYRNECVNFETIYQTLWSFEETPSDVSLRTYIKKLRKYLSKERIRSIKKVGYKLLVDY